MSFRLGVDIGGTFTDLVLIEDATGAVHRGKTLTTPDNPIQGILTGVNRMKSDLALQPGDITGAVHATTLVANTLIERKGAATGLLTTKGFRDVLELGMDARYDIYDLNIVFPGVLVPRQWRLGIAERTAVDGEALRAPDETEVIAAAQSLLDDGVRSVAICFLHSYRNAAHERLVRDLLAHRFPDVDVSISAEVAPEIREYERTVTVVANAYVLPLMRRYLRRLDRALQEAGVSGSLFVMLSNGGLTTAATAADTPIQLVESGPAAGVMAAKLTANADEPDLLAFDMGGTTAKACLITDREPAFTGTLEVARQQRQMRGSGLPLKVPSIEMIEIGAGGGSIAHLDKTGLLKVGPQSAGADPGPACYAQGGTAPTVTDADLLLGYLDPGYFLGGAMQLDRSAAEAAVAGIAAPLGLTNEEAAAGIVRVVNNSMATAIRIHAAERGEDYRRYALYAFGGAGPVHAYELMRLLQLEKLICPLGAGTNSAFGLLAAPTAIDLSRSHYARLDAINWGHLTDLYEDMEEQARAVLAEAGVAEPQFLRSAEMRFVGQGFEVPATIPNGPLSPGSLPAMRTSFLSAYERLYRSTPGDLLIEGLTWRLRASGPLPKLAPFSAAIDARTTAKKGERRVYFPEVAGFLATPVFARYALRPDQRLAGPAIIEERESTLVVGPSGNAQVRPDLRIAVTIGSQNSSGRAREGQDS